MVHLVELDLLLGKALLNSFFLFKSFLPGLLNFLLHFFEHLMAFVRVVYLLLGFRTPVAEVTVQLMLHFSDSLIELDEHVVLLDELLVVLQLRIVHLSVLLLALPQLSHHLAYLVFIVALPVDLEKRLILFFLDAFQSLLFFNELLHARFLRFNRIFKL